MITVYRMVTYGEILARLTEGYRVCADLGPTHGAWSVLMVWEGEGEAP